jgi:HD-GYP domain-containing protein (c-di-GMP phosphodiesterase class II)
MQTVEIYGYTCKKWGILDTTLEDQEISSIVLSHHERFDGKGIREDFKGKISMEARIIAVADTYDAIIIRPYRKLWIKSQR